MFFSKNSFIKLIESLISEFNSLNIYPVLGAELEFFLTPLDNKANSNLWQAQKLNIDLNIDHEKGQNQFEVRTLPTRDVFKLIDEITQLKIQIKTQAQKQGMEAVFLAKPFDNEPGSALHVHIHLENMNQDNLFCHENKESTLFFYAIGGLCKFMPQSMIFFAPYEQAYLRYKTKSLESPSKICWGKNNRSAAIRVPRHEKFNLRIEHRVSCADSNPEQVLASILFAIMSGIRHQTLPLDPVYGNAFLEQYDYPLLPTYEEAIQSFQDGELKKFLCIV